MEKIAFLFPGQGSQYVGMSKSLYDQYDIAKHTFEEANDTLGFDLAKLCFEGNLADLGKIENALVTLLTSSVVAFRVFMKEIGIPPQFCLGHSLGEYSALTCSGALRFSDALKIVLQRSELAQETAESINGTMSIIDGLTAEVVMRECNQISVEKSFVAVSCFNSLKQVAISGHLEAVQKVEDRVLELGGQVTPLIGNPPFHSPLMQPAALQLQEELNKYSFSYIRYPVVSNVTALPYEGPETIARNLTGHMIRPVQWQSSMEYLNKHSITLAVEMGPKNVLGNLLKQNFGDIQVMSFDHKEDRKALSDLFPNNPLYGKYVPTVITKCLAVAVATPNANFDPDEYQSGVVEPYRKLRALQDESEGKGAVPTYEQMKEALETLRVILNTKKISSAEQQEWFEEIFDETGTRYIFKDFQISA